MGLKILVTADWHLDSPLSAYPQLRDVQRQIPGKIAELAKDCDLVLIPGDIFEGSYTKRSLQAVTEALDSIPAPVFIAPGNHDYFGGRSPYDREIFPENVYIFRKDKMQGVPLPDLNCTVYGAAFTSPEPSDFLRDFHTAGEGYQIGILHSTLGEPITAAEGAASGLDFFALGHIHKMGHIQAGKTLCLWPGSPMGRDFGELGRKGAWIVEMDERGVKHRFVPLGLPCFYGMDVDVGNFCLPAMETDSFYRITLTGRGELPPLPELPNVTWVDRSLPPLDIWATAEEDSLEGLFLRKLRKQAENGEELARYAAELSRRLLDGEELP